MKKLLIILLVLLLAGCSTKAPITIESINKELIQYYTSMDSISNMDDLIAMEALGIHSCDYPLDFTINTKTVGSLAKAIIGLSLYQDPDIQDLVIQLEESIDETGKADKNANMQIYVVYGLYVCHSSKLELATDCLVNFQNENGSFSTITGEDLDLTGWALEAFCLVDQNRYQEAIQKAIDYIESCHQEDHHYEGGHQANPDSQSSVLYGLMEANYNYHTEDFEFVYRYRNSDGTYYSPTSKEGVNNPYTTSEVAKLIGNKVNGNVLKKARDAYEKIN